MPANAEIENHGLYFSINEEAFQVNIYPINYTPESVEVLEVGLGGLWNGTMENKVYQPLKRLKINLLAWTYIEYTPMAVWHVYCNHPDEEFLKRMY